MFVKRLLKDSITTPEEMFSLLSFPIYIAQDKDDKIISFRIIGMNRDSFVCARYSGYYQEDEDFGFGSGWRSYEEAFELPFNEVDDTYILASAPTEKQMAWLEKFQEEYSCSSLNDITGYEAWHLINKHVKAVEARRKQRKEEEERRYNCGYDWEDADWLPEIGINGF